MHPQDEYSKPNRAEQVWSHFSGMFGGDAVKRKFGTKPPTEWESALTYLTDNQLRHGLETIVKSGAEHIPTLPQFLHACRNSREWEDDGATRITATLTDKWGVAANNHLLAHVWKCAARKQFFDADQTRILVQFKNSWAEDMRADDKGEGISVEQQRVAWEDCMERADQQIAQLSQEKAA